MLGGALGTGRAATGTEELSKLDVADRLGYFFLFRREVFGQSVHAPIEQGNDQSDNKQEPKECRHSHLPATAPQPAAYGWR